MNVQIHHRANNDKIGIHSKRNTLMHVYVRYMLCFNMS